jgi:hypothetical protein
MTARIRHALFLSLLLVIAAGCGKNYIRSGLSNSDPVVMPTVTENTIYIQTGNTSENQRVSLAGLNSRISSKGYQVLNDPAAAYYWLQARVIYCHEAKESVTAETVARTGFGSGIGSGGSPMINLNSLTGKNGDKGKSPDINAILDKILVMADKTIFPAPEREGVLYLCVADVQITEHNNSRAKTGKAGPSEFRMRTVAHVLQKKLNIEEATPIIQAKLNAGIAGMF